ncbi:MAG: hypothetical protein RIC93_09475 [Alphaproteobacteria bacterium]
MNRRFSIFISFAAIFVLAACETQTTHVTRFSRFAAIEPGKTFAMYAMDQKKADTLEFKHYTRMIRNKVRSVTGWIPASPDGPHDYKVAFDYTAGKPRTTYYYPGYGSGLSVGSGYWGHRSFFSTGYAFGPPYDWETHYDYQLKLDIRANVGGGDHTAPDSKIFEAKASATDLASDISYVMPCMLTALFRNFPGGDGQSYSVTIPYEECTPRPPQ